MSPCSPYVHIVHILFNSLVWNVTQQPLESMLLFLLLLQTQIIGEMAVIVSGTQSQTKQCFFIQNFTISVII